MDYFEGEKYSFGVIKISYLRYGFATRIGEIACDRGRGFVQCKDKPHRHSLMSIRHAAGAALMSIAISGCATWVNPQYRSDAEAARHFKIDKGRCKMAAAGSRPYPVPSSPPPTQTTMYQGQSYDWTGGESRSYSGTATTRNSNAFGNGVAQGMNTANSVIAAGTQRDIYEGCLMNLGWHKK